MAIRKPRKQKKDNQAWLTTYADALTLVLCFFVLLLSASSFDPQKYTRIKNAVMEQVGGSGDKDIETYPPVDPMALIKNQGEEFRELVKHLSKIKGVEISPTDQGIRIEIKDKVLFKSGSAVIKHDFLASLDKFSEMIVDVQKKSDLTIEIQGHTDDAAIKSVAFPSNWELSARRATNVLRFMIKRGVKSDNMRAIAFAHTKPKVPNKNKYGEVIEGNRAKNRRVVLELNKVTKLAPKLSQHARALEQ